MNPHKLALVFLLTCGTAAVSFASEDNKNVQLKIDIAGTVDTNCKLSGVSSFQNLGVNSYRIATIDRFCNTPYQLTMAHNATVSGGTVSIGSDIATLEQGSFIVVPLGHPVNSAADIIVQGVSLQTAQEISGSLSLNILPRNF